MFSEIQDYRETLEIRHLRTKNHFVIALLGFVMVLSLVYMSVTKFPISEIVSLHIGYVVVIIFNIANLAYGRENFRFYQLNKYITTIGTFSLAIVTVFLFKSPAAITALFIAYAISAYYQDLKIVLLGNVLLLFSVVMFMMNYPEYLNMEASSPEDKVGIAIFFVAFVTILTIASYIIVKQKQFFYNQIALSKETEFRSIDLFIDLQKAVYGKDVDVKDYYGHLEAFLEAFSGKLGIENAFQEKLRLLREMEEGTPFNLLSEKYPAYSRDDFERLENLLIGNKHKLRKIAIKMSHTFNVDVKKREMFSETHFKSLNHQKDSLEIKILAFAVFYSALKRGLSGLPELEDQAIREALTGTDYYYYIDPRVIGIYQKNSEVFDAISSDILRKEGSQS